MLALISFILVTIGCINWFCIGILQFDFVAGIFGSQSNIFSRLIYTLVGIASIIMVVNFITNKGKFIVSFKKANKEFEDMKEERKEERRRKALATESAEEFSLSKKLQNNYQNTRKYNTESGMDNSEEDDTDDDQNNTTDTTENNCSCHNKNKHK